MKALLKAAIGWRNADDLVRSILDAMAYGDYDYDEYQRLKAKHERVIADLVLPARSALHLAIEQAEDDSA